MKETSVYAAIFKAMTEAIIICDANFAILDINQGGLQFCGCAAATYIGRPINDLIAWGNGPFPGAATEVNLLTSPGGRRILLSQVQVPAQSRHSCYYLYYLQELPDNRTVPMVVADSTEHAPIDIVHSLDRYLWEFDLDGTIVYLSNRIQDLLGYYPQELIGLPMQQIFTPSSKQEFISLLQAGRYEPAKLAHFVCQAFAKDGRVVCLSNNGVPKFNNDNKLIGFRGTTLDITTDKIIEEALSESEEQFQLIVNAMAEGLVIYNKENKIIAANKQAEKILGLSFAKMLGRTSLEPELKFIREDGTHFPADEYPPLITLKTGKSCQNVIMGSYNNDGKLFWILVNTEGIGGSDNKLPRRVIATFHDITNLIHTERELSTANERLQNILSSLDLLFWSKDMITGKLYLLSQGCQEVLGFPPKEFIDNQEKWCQIIHPEDRHIFENLNTEILAGKIGANDYRIFHRAGELHWIRDYRIPAMGPNGKLERIDGMIMEITYRKLQEEELKAAKSMAEEASEAKSNFLATISHEIRTPLNGIIGMAEMLQRTGMSARQQDCLNAITNSADLLLAIINDVLDLSKIEAGKMDIEAVPFQLTSLIRDIEGLCRARLQSERVTLSVQIDEALAGTMLGDANRISQVLLNLVGNAVKFTNDGSIAIDVRRELETEAAMRVMFQIADTGIGIPKEMHESLFRPFQQADGSTSRRFGGTGLGLAISKRLVELMEGAIGFSSVPGVGSNFWFSLPIKKDNQSQLIVHKPVEAKASFHSQNPMVLVVEDNPVNQQVALAQLEAVGSKVHIACNGQEAIKLFDQYRYDLIFMDCHMPEMDGFETTRFIRLKENPAKRTPIIAMTALAMTGDFERCLEAGMDDYITKPVKLNTLYGIMKRYLKMIS